MKAFLFILFFISSFAFGQNEEPDVATQDKELTLHLDSLRIPYKYIEKKYFDARDTVVDGLNTLIVIGDFSKKNVAEYITKINDSQKIYEIPNDIYSVARAEQLISAVQEGTAFKIISEKSGLLADYYTEKSAELRRNQGERILKFLRETKYPASDFKKLSPEEQQKLVVDFENKK